VIAARLRRQHFTDRIIPLLPCDNVIKFLRLACFPSPQQHDTT
jgi:hypothetical protein